MNINTIIDIDQSCYLNTFGKRIPLYFTHGENCTLYDQDGKAYLDFLAGIAVNSLGYSNQDFLDAVAEQSKNIMHCSNYFYNVPQTLLAQLLVENTCADRVFFTNSGAEANEGAMKLARKYFYDKGEDRTEFISATSSFHGRTFATVAITAQEKYQKPYAPLLPGVSHVEYNDIDALKAAVGPHTCAVIIECIQGEGGVTPASAEYLKAVRQLCDETGTLLIFDEVQTGMGRTGSLYCHQGYGVEPDIFTSAKALGNGLPIGAILSKNFCASFVPGDHGTTYGGNPLCCAGALSVLKTMLQPGFLESVTEKGEKLMAALKAIDNPAIVEVRGKGLMIGIQLTDDHPVGAAAAALREKGFIIGTAGKNTIRLVPPLVMSEEELLSIVPAIAAIL